MNVSEKPLVAVVAIPFIMRLSIHSSLVDNPMNWTMGLEKDETRKTKGTIRRSLRIVNLRLWAQFKSIPDSFQNLRNDSNYLQKHKFIKHLKKS